MSVPTVPSDDAGITSVPVLPPCPFATASGSCMSRGWLVAAGPLWETVLPAGVVFSSRAPGWFWDETDARLVLSEVVAVVRRSGTGADTTGEEAGAVGVDRGLGCTGEAVALTDCVVWF